MLVCNDHEEVGSCSACGADGPMLEQTLRRLLPEGDEFVRTIQKSLLVSADNAHGVHPNYAEKHDANHGPKLNAGPVIKVNSNQRYATNSETAGFFRHLCMAQEVPVQSFVVRSDMGCGSTIGPDYRQPPGRAYRGHRPADIRHALDSRTVRQPRPGASGEGAWVRSTPAAICPDIAQCGRGLAPDGGDSVIAMSIDTPLSGASPLPHGLRIYPSGKLTCITCTSHIPT